MVFALSTRKIWSAGTACMEIPGHRAPLRACRSSLLALSRVQMVVNRAKPVEKAPIAVLGPGTGLGEAQMMWDDSQASIVGTLLSCWLYALRLMGFARGSTTQFTPHATPA